MTGILSLTTFTPMIGVAAIVLLRLFAGSGHEASKEAARWIALATTLATFALSILVVANFQPSVPGFQMTENWSWFAGVNYRMGIDGISVLFVLLTGFLMPLCILASWKSIDTRVLEYM